MTNHEHEPEQIPDKTPKPNRLNRYSAYLYLAMALMIVGVAVASIFALNRSIDDLPEYSTPEFSIAPIPNESSADKFIPILPDESDDTPVFGEESGVVDDSSSGSPVIEEGPHYVMPVEAGEILKGCALDKLVFSATMNDYRVHTGLDLSAPLGAEVYCYAAGTVESIQNDDFYGVTVSVRHEYGLVTVYSNLAAELANGIAVGKELKAGDVLGYVGKTALAEAADEPHLHFEMVLNGTNIDPERELFE